MGESSWDVMLTSHLHLGCWLRVSGASPLIPLRAFVVLTKSSPRYSQLHALDLVVVYNVIDIRLLSLFYW
jgi:hypothetical protein